MNKVVNGLLILLLLFTCQVLASELFVSLPRTISQDHQGLLWVGTQTQAKRYNGHDFETTVDNCGYINNIVHQNNTTYVAASLAVVAVDEQLQQSVLYQADRSNRVLDIAVENSHLFILTQRRILQVDLSKPQLSFKVFSEHAQLKHGLIRLEYGNLYVASNNQVTTYRAGKNVAKTYRVNSKVHSMFAIENQVYAITQNDLLAVYVDSIKTIKTFNQPIQRAVAANDQNFIWLAFENEIKKFDIQDKSFDLHMYNTNNQRNVFALFESADKTLWLATEQLVKLSENYLSVNAIDGLSQTTGMGWLVDAFRNSYFIDVGGVYYFDTENRQAIPVEAINKVAKGHHYAAYSDYSDVWFGGYYGLFKLNDSSQQLDNLSHLISKNPVQCIREVNYEIIAVCVDQDGVYFIDKETNVVTDKIAHENMSSIVDVLPIDGYDKHIWLATDQGVYQQKNEQLTQYLNHSHVIRLTHLDGVVYAATLGNGVFAIDPTANTVTPIDFADIGERIHDVKRIANNIAVTTALGVGTYNPITQKTNTWPLGYAVGRLERSLHAISAKGQLVRWGDSTYTKQFDATINLTNIKVDGKRQSLNQPIAANSYVELTLNLDDFKNSQAHLYKIKINNAPWGDYSTINHIGLVPAFGKNVIKVQAKYNNEITTSEFVLQVVWPWYWSWYACLMYLTCLVTMVRYVVIAWRENEERFIEQNFKFGRLIYQNNKENLSHNDMIERRYNYQLKQLSDTVLDNNADLACKLYEKNVLKVTRSYEPLTKSLNKVMADIETQHYEKASHDIEQLQIGLQLEALVNAPEVLVNNDLISGLEQLIVSIQSSRNFVRINTDFDKIGLMIDERIEPMSPLLYRAVYEVLHYLVDECASLDMELNVKHHKVNVTVTLKVLDRTLNYSAFNQQNIGLYQARLIARKLNAQLLLTPISKTGTSISIVTPLPEKPDQTTPTKKQSFPFVDVTNQRPKDTDIY